MSLILEALAKSEAERRRGQTPDLFTPMPQSAAPTKSSRVLLIAGALSLLCVIAIGLWWFTANRSETITPIAAQEPTATIAPTPAPPASAPEIQPPTLSDNTSDGNIAPAATVPTPAATIEPPPVAAAPAPVAAAPAPPAPVAPTPPAPTVAPPTAPPAAPVDNPIASNQDVLPADEPLPADMPEPDMPEPAIVEEPIVDSSAARPQPLSMLGGALQGLPPMKISVYVWAENAQRRFIVMDGQRTVEGGRIGDQATLSRIDKDGFVINWQGQEYWVDRP